MKRLLFIVFGVLASACLVYLSALAIGALFGPLYQSEDESIRNFKIFLALLAAGVIGGGYLADRIYRARFKPGP